MIQKYRIIPTNRMGICLFCLCAVLISGCHPLEKIRVAVMAESPRDQAIEEIQLYSGYIASLYLDQELKDIGGEYSTLNFQFGESGVIAKLTIEGTKFYDTTGEATFDTYEFESNIVEMESRIEGGGLVRVRGTLTDSSFIGKMYIEDVEDVDTATMNFITTKLNEQYEEKPVED